MHTPSLLILKFWSKRCYTWVITAGTCQPRSLRCWQNNPEPLTTLFPTVPLMTITTCMLNVRPKLQPGLIFMPCGRLSCEFCLRIFAAFYSAHWLIMFRGHQVSEYPGKLHSFLNCIETYSAVRTRFIDHAKMMLKNFLHRTQYFCWSRRGSRLIWKRNIYQVKFFRNNWISNQGINTWDWSAICIRLRVVQEFGLSIFGFIGARLYFIL